MRSTILCLAFGVCCTGCTKPGNNNQTAFETVSAQKPVKTTQQQSAIKIDLYPIAEAYKRNPAKADADYKARRVVATMPTNSKPDRFEQKNCYSIMVQRVYGYRASYDESPLAIIYFADETDLHTVKPGSTIECTIEGRIDDGIQRTTGEFYIKCVDAKLISNVSPQP